VTRYTDGRRFEYAVRNDLTVNGYEVIRSAGSKTKVDLVAFKQGQCVFVQCKRDGKIRPAERTELLRLAALIDAVPVVAWKRPGAAKVLYAEVTGRGVVRAAWNPDFTEEAS